MRTDLFDFDLPSDRIALRPASPRDSARLLVVRPGAAAELEDHIVRELPDLLRPGDQLVVNDTKVIAAQLRGRRIGRGPDAGIDATLIKRIDGARWQALVKPARRLEPGDVVRFGEEGGVCFLGELDATVEAKGEAGEVTFGFAFDGPTLDAAIAARGEVPLPPYIAGRRAADERDRADYQTVFARAEGAVAAPTAGLHFTQELTAALAARGIDVHTVTLHVGAGTFLPVKVEDVAQHKMHAEWGEVNGETAAALNAARAAGGRIVAVGTTSLRLLESAARDDRGIAPFVIAPFSGETAIFITPGYRFRAVDVLLTNFHLPRSTLFMLVAAFCGIDVMKRAYAHAIAEGYRFYSYGDASLLFPGHG
jgi:S-adenosylmethionine:tRNA ribosyltransferase-isomerase